MGKNLEPQPIALVLGFSIHGLAVARALHSTGIRVHAISESGDLPTCKTSAATVHIDHRINSERAIDCLRDFRNEIAREEKIIVFPTNDKIVGLLAHQWEELADNFHLSWSDCRYNVQELVRKDGFESFVNRHDLLSPRSIILNDASDVRSELESFEGSLIVKPVVPLGSFKALRYDSLDKAIADAGRWVPDFPVIVQEWIEGDDIDLVFGSFFVGRGKIVAEFSGRKLLSTPRALGQGVIVEEFWDEEVLRKGREVALALDVSGPIAVEFKRDRKGRLWLIEANVGRTEYSIDLLVGSGLNLPLLEYQHVCGTTPTERMVVSRRNVTWLDTEKEPLALFRYLASALARRQPIRKMVFPYFGHNDLAPYWAATAIYVRRVYEAVLRRVTNLPNKLRQRPHGG